tara:strand:- start:10820 stop:11296 length:477 start_codon:yes stop_codon:yes gene_type:complete
MSKKIAIIMGSQSDWSTMKVAAEVLEKFNVPYEKKIISAHRTPERLYKFARESAKNYDLIIAGAGGAAHLPGMVASITSIPVLGVPIVSKFNNGLDSLLSIIQMPKGVPVGTLAVGESGAANSALLAISILSLSDKNLRKSYEDWRIEQTSSVDDIPK